MDEELSEHLGYDRYDPTGHGSGNYRNGTRAKTVLTDACGSIEIEVPRDRARPGLTLLVIDELGYLPLPAEAASALFQVVSQRYLKTSIVITTNRGVGAWGDILGDTTVAAAMLDRLLHRSVVINLDGESYRLRDHHAAAETLRRAATGTRQPIH